MSDDYSTLTLDEVNPDGAISETMEQAIAGTTRGDFLKRFAVGASGMTIAGALIAPAGASAAASTGSPAQDIDVLNYALTLEYLEQAFYIQATKSGLNRVNANFAKVVAAHETAHVKAILATIKALGGTPVAKPTFNFKGTNAKDAVFRKTALALEETGVTAYAGQVTRLDNPAVLKAAASIHSVEARHAAWMRAILGINPAPRAFDKPRTIKQTLAVVTGTGFIKG